MTSKFNALRLADWLESSEHPTDQKFLEAAQELRKLHDLLGKANALSRIRASRIAELEALFAGEADYREFGSEPQVDVKSSSGCTVDSTPKPVELVPVPGDLLPAIGSRVFIRHGRDNSAHACTVVGYYVWPAVTGGTASDYHRVFVRLVYEGTTLVNARMLSECWSTQEQALAAD